MVADAHVTYNAIEPPKTEPGRKTKTKVITLANKKITASANNANKITEKIHVIK